MERKIAIVGLGYVGLPLAVEFSKIQPVMAFDINEKRIQELQQGFDSTYEVSSAELGAAALLTFTAELSQIAWCDVYIVTVPTPIDTHKKPDLSCLYSASELVASVLKRGDIVVYESTVYPGTVEGVCAPILAKKSSLEFNRDFFVGYSPERVNPGDKEHRIATIKKIVSGSTPEVADVLETLYQQIVPVGIHKTSSIRVAEAAKVIENTQRDINIALINELAIIFNKLDIDTEEVLKAAETKWNFISFRPGLVGGHCIGVDPYYLTYVAESVGYRPEIILAGRRLNDDMGYYIVSQLIKAMARKQISICGARVLMMGLTFKENCPDLRNTRVLDIITELQEYRIEVEVYDPWVSEASMREHELSRVEYPKIASYDAIVLAVAHHQFKEMKSEEIHSFGKQPHVLYDLKYLLPQNASDIRL